MKKEKILDALDSISEKYVDEGTPAAVIRNGGMAGRIIAAAACICVAVTAALLIRYNVKEPPEGIESALVTENTDEVSAEQPTDKPESTAINTETQPGSDDTETETESGSITELSTSPIGGSDYCFIHHHTYHAIPGELISFVISNKGTTESEVYEWLESATVDGAKPTVNSNYCNLLNIKMVFDKYEITEEEFYNNCSIMNCTSLDIHMLCTETNEEIDEYFRNIELLSLNTSRESHYRRITILIREAYAAELEDLGILYTAKSVPELIHILSIEREDLLKYITEATKFYADENGVCYTFDYNLDMIYGDGELQAGEMTFASLEELLAVNADGDPDNDISSNELSEMFCRVGRYAE